MLAKVEGVNRNPNLTPRSIVVHIKPKKDWQLLDLRELQQYRDLFYFLVARDIKVKYKQTILGGLWAIIQPLFMMLVFTLFFGKLAKIPSDDVPYSIFNYTAMVAWTYFATVTSSAAQSLIADASLVQKVYCPRVIIPLTPILAGLLDFVIAFAVLIGLMFYFRIYPTSLVTVAPLLVFIMILTASGVGILLAALNIKYRDIKYTTTFLLQLWMFASPVVYPASMIPEQYRILYAINPMVGVIEGLRSVLLGTTPFPIQAVALAAIVSSVLFAIGLLYFRKTARYFADVI